MLLQEEPPQDRAFTPSILTFSVLGDVHSSESKFTSLLSHKETTISHRSWIHLIKHRFEISLRNKFKGT